MREQHRELSEIDPQAAAEAVAIPADIPERDVAVVAVVAGDGIRTKMCIRDRNEGTASFNLLQMV